MYRKTIINHPQIVFDFAMPFGGEIDPENRWVKKKELMPWEYIEEIYQSTLSGSDQGSPALSGCIAFGALYIQEFLGITDRETVAQITENPYLQFFLGYKKYTTKPPFDHTMMVTFRKRFTEEMLADINERTVGNALGRDSDDNDGGDADVPLDTDRSSESEQGAENKGKLIIDATCTPADITYPTDLKLLNEAREKTEEIIDRMHEPYIGKEKKPRTYRQRARKEYLVLAQQKKPGKRKIRKAIRKQLGYLKRNLKTIDKMASKGRLGLLSKRLYRLVLVINELYRQQRCMYANKVHRADNRIVSIYQPHVRPIVRGKAGKPVEFGAKISISLVDGYSFVDHLSWEAYNESGDLIPQIESYKQRYGCYPESVHVDTIYRNRDNRLFCQKHGIRLSGPQLGRPPKETAENKEQLKEVKQQQRQDEKDRQAVEGKFGQGKRRFSLSRIMAKLAETSETVIMMSFIVMNVEKVLRDLLLFLFIGLDMLRRTAKRAWQQACNGHRIVRFEVCRQIKRAG